MSSKRQQTMAKTARERTVRERRAKKLEKKQAARAEKKARAAGEWPVDETDVLGDEAEAGERGVVPPERDASFTGPGKDAPGNAGA